MTKLPISVCIIAKNEEKHIGQCLRHLLPYGMEIVVVDTGSTDETAAIARKYTDKVYDFEWINDFSAARNFAVSQASNNWILVVDCDEYIKELDAPKLRQCMQQNARNAGVLQITNVYTQPDGTKTYRTDEVPRFYNKNFYEYRYRIHEQITPKNATDPDSVTLYTFHLPIVVEHYGYDIPREEMLKKQERNLRLLTDSLGEGHMDDYLYFQIGQSHYVLGNYEKAIEAYDLCLELNSNDNKNFLPIALSSYAEALFNLGRNEDACRLLTMNEDYLGTARLRFQHGKACQLCGDDLGALASFIQATLMPDFDSLGDDAYSTYARILSMCRTTGNEDKIELYKRRLLDYAAAHGKQIVFE